VGIETSVPEKRLAAIEKRLQALLPEKP